MFREKGVLRNFAKFTGKHQSLKETLAQVFFCEFCEFSKNIFFHGTPPMAASAYRKRFCSWFSTQFVILMNPRPLSILGMYNLSVSLCGWYIVFIVIMFRVFLSITFSSSFAHFSIPAPYLTKDTAREFISLMYFHHSISMMSVV